MPPQFTVKMQKAVAYYARDPKRCKADAYRHAYDCSKMQQHIVTIRAVELFKHPLVAQVVQQILAHAAAKVAIDAAWVLKRAALLADFNIKKFIKKQEDGTAIYDFSTATDDDWYCISEYTVDTLVKGSGKSAYEVDRVKLRTTCKIQALKLVGQHTNVQAFKETVEHTGVVGIRQLSTEEYKQARREMLAGDDC